MNKTIIAFLLALTCASTYGQQITITSPNKKLSATVRLTKDGIRYQLMRENKMVIQWSKLSLTLDGNEFSSNLTFPKPKINDVWDKYDQRIGKASHVE